MLTFVYRMPFAFLLAVSLAVSTLAADKPTTLAARLAGYEHVETVAHPDTGLVVLRLLTAKQQERNLKDLAERRKQQSAYNEQVSLLQAQMQAAQGEERRKLAEEYDRLRSSRTVDRGVFTRGIYYTLVSVGEDYLELRSTDGKDSVSLLPLRLVSRVHLPEKEPAAEPAPKP